MINIQKNVNPNFHILNNHLALHQINPITTFQHINPSPLNSNYISTKILSDKKELHSISDDQSNKQSEFPIKNKKENTLDKLTQNFITFCREQKNEKISINSLLRKYSNKKRRIYDITNVLQGIGFIKKLEGNDILWMQNYPKGNMTKKRIPNEEQANSEKIKTNLIELVEENNAQNKELKLLEDEFQKDFDENLEKYGYITKEDICNLSKKLNKNFILIKTEENTVINVMDNETQKIFKKISDKIKNGKMIASDKIKKLIQNEHHISVNNFNGRFTIYKCFNGELNEERIIIEENNNENEHD